MSFLQPGLRGRHNPRCAPSSAGSGAHLKTPMQIYKYMHTFRFTPMYAESHQGPHATLALSNTKGQTSAEEGWPSQQKDAWSSSRPWAPREGWDSESPLVELARHCLSVPRQALPRMTQESPVCRHATVLVGRRREASTQVNPEKAKSEPRAPRILSSYLQTLEPGEGRGWGWGWG